MAKLKFIDIGKEEELDEFGLPIVKPLEEPPIIKPEEELPIAKTEEEPLPVSTKLKFTSDIGLPSGPQLPKPIPTPTVESIQPKSVEELFRQTKVAHENDLDYKKLVADSAKFSLAYTYSRVPERLGFGAVNTVANLLSSGFNKVGLPNIAKDFKGIADKTKVAPVTEKVDQKIAEMDEFYKGQGKLQQGAFKMAMAAIEAVSFIERVNLVTDVLGLAPKAPVKPGVAKGILGKIFTGKGTMVEMAKRAATIGGMAIAETPGDVKTKFGSALYSIANYMTGPIANATGAVGLNAMAIDTMLNATLDMPSVIKVLKSSKDPGEAFVNLLPTVTSWFVFALDTRGKDINQRINYMNKQSPDFAKLSKPEKIDFISKLDIEASKIGEIKPVEIIPEKPIVTPEIKTETPITEATPKPVTAIPKGLEGLAEEAKKYGSAEEFVKDFYIEPSYSATPGTTALTEAGKNDISEKSYYHGTQFSSLGNILKEGIISPKTSSLDTLGEKTISLSKNKSVAGSYGIVVFEIDKSKINTRNIDVSKVVTGNVPEGFEVRYDKDIKLSDIKRAIIRIGTGENLDTKVWDNIHGKDVSTTIGEYKVKLEKAGIKTFVVSTDKSQLSSIYTQATTPATEKTAEIETPVKPPIPPSPPTTHQKAEEPMGDPIVRLSELIKQAKPLRGKLEKAYTEERGKRISEVERVIDEIGGEKGYIAALSKLKGELASPENKRFNYEPIKDKLTKPEVDALYNRIFKHPYLDNYEKINSANELTKLFAGELPTPKGLVLLEEVYGTDLIKNILGKRAFGLKLTDTVVDVLNIPRVLLSMADMSGFLRQGAVEVAAHPIIAAKAMGKTFQFAFSPKSFKQYFKDLTNDKLYPLMRKSGLDITDPARYLASGHEEAFMSRLMQKTPILGQLARFSERSYTGFLTKLRVDVFKTMSDEFLSRGFSPVKDIRIFKATADVVNTFTGRGSLGKLNAVAPVLNTLFFSTRLNVGRFQTFNPVWYANKPKEVRVKAIGDFAKFVAAGTTLLALASASGLGEVETDTRSSDSGKVRIGNSRWDIWGGFQQWVRVFSQLISGERKNTETGEIVSLSKDEYPFTTREDVLVNFIKGKLAPVPALISELIDGAKTFEGEDITAETIAKGKFIPMYIQDIADAYKDGGMGRAVGVGIPAFFGVNVQTYKPTKEVQDIFELTMPKSNKLNFVNPKLNIKSNKLKFK